jgi:catechol 2,3-dioxygenase
MAYNIIRPTLRHFGLTTANLQGMKDWYAKVLGMTPNHETAAPDGTAALPPMQASWVTNDGANHRIAIMALAGMTADADRSHHQRLQHIAFELPTIDGLLQTYTRLKIEGIEPVITADHGATTSFYYEDPDRNSGRKRVSPCFFVFSRPLPFWRERVRQRHILTFNIFF